MKINKLYFSRYHDEHYLKIIENVAPNISAIMSFKREIV